MPRILSGIQPSGRLHLGNYCGAIRQFVALQQDYEMFIFVASYHALTSTSDPQALRCAMRDVVIDYLAYGLDGERCNIYLQHDLPEVTELAWILGCHCPKYMMDKAVSFKDKTAKGLAASIGLYTYPVLQAADILIVDADLVPVGRDQVQHIEITRDIAQRFNHGLGAGEQLLKPPAYRLDPSAEVLPGIDGQKMSKSYGNTIDPFMGEKPLRKRIMRIVTDSTPVEDPKDPESCPVFAIFRAIAGAEDERSRDLADRYRNGGLAYGHAKQALFELIMDHFAEARRQRARLVADPGLIDAVLARGAAAARAAAGPVMERVRRAVGLGACKE